MDGTQFLSTPLVEDVGVVFSFGLLQKERYDYPCVGFGVNLCFHYTWVIRGRGVAGRVSCARGTRKLPGPLYHLAFLPGATESSGLLPPTPRRCPRRSGQAPPTLPGAFPCGFSESSWVFVKHFGTGGISLILHLTACFFVLHTGLTAVSSRTEHGLSVQWHVLLPSLAHHDL